MRTLESYTLPQAWACAIVNGDYSGMSDDDKKACNTFLALNGLSFCMASVESFAGFVRMHDAFNLMPLAAECNVYQFLKEGE